MTTNMSKRTESKPGKGLNVIQPPKSTRRRRPRPKDKCAPLASNPHSPTGANASCSQPQSTPDNNNHRSAGEVSDDDVLVISCQQVKYRAPRDRMVRDLTPPNQVDDNGSSDSARLVVGVLSAGKDADRRQSIRETWATNLPRGHVYFVVGGDWSVVEREYRDFHDLIWVDRQEDFNLLTFKMGVMVSVLHEVATEGSFTQLLKTDDDIYWNIAELTEVLSPEGEAFGTDYYGNCNMGMNYPIRPYEFKNGGGDPYKLKYVMNKTTYPERCYAGYCMGWGYTMSPALVDCIAREIPFIRYMPFEDVMVGLLAQRCGGFQPTHYYQPEQWLHEYRDETWVVNMTGKIMQHPVKTLEDMMARHQSIVG